MAQKPIETVLKQLDTLLDRERQALLTGQLNDIARIAEEKEDLIATLRSAEIENRAMLDPIQHKLGRNQTLLSGTMDGVRAVSDRLTALRKARSTLDTYDKSGRKRSIVTRADSKVEKRA